MAARLRRLRGAHDDDAGRLGHAVDHLDAFVVERLRDRSTPDERSVPVSVALSFDALIALRRRSEREGVTQTALVARAAVAALEEEAPAEPASEGAPSSARTSVRMPPGLLARILVRAERDGVTRSDVLRHAIDSMVRDDS
jgi:hypothetical protein